MEHNSAARVRGEVEGGWGGAQFRSESEGGGGGRMGWKRGGWGGRVGDGVVMSGG